MEGVTDYVVGQLKMRFEAAKSQGVQENPIAAGQFAPIRKPYVNSLPMMLNP